MGSGCGKPAATLRGEPDADGVDRNGIVRNLKGEEGTSNKNIKCSTSTRVYYL